MTIEINAPETAHWTNNLRLLTNYLIYLLLEILEKAAYVFTPYCIFQGAQWLWTKYHRRIVERRQYRRVNRHF